MTVVDPEVSALVRPRRGHFDFGTGFHGDLWLDLDALFLRPALLTPHIRRLANLLAGERIDAVCGPMEGGALLAYAIAGVMGVAFLPAYRAPARREAPAFRLPAAPGGIAGWRVAIADDAVNAGTAVRACAGLLRGGGAVPVAIAALLAVGPASGVVAQTLGVPFHAVGAISSQAWPAGTCSLCASGVPFTET